MLAASICSLKIRMVIHLLAIFVATKRSYCKNMKVYLSSRRVVRLMVKSVLRPQHLILIVPLPQQCAHD